MGFFDFIGDIGSTIGDLGSTALDLATGGIKSLIGNAPSMLAQGAMNVATAKQASDQSSEMSQEAFERSMGAYKQRYQHTAADMKSAGLNPILAASGGFNVGGQPQASMPQTFASAPVAMETGSATARNIAEASKTNLERQKVLKEISLLGEQANLAIQQAYEANAREGVANQQEKNLQAEFVKIKTETLRIATEISKVGEETKNITIGRQLIKQNIREMKAIADKLEMTNKNYTGPAGDILGFINALTDALNLGIRR